MASVHVLVGQCGNQLGLALFNALAAEARQSDDEYFQREVSSQYFRTALDTRHCRGGSAGDDAGIPEARAVMVDMEPKVIEESMAACSANGHFALSSTQCVTKEEGSANNFAFGFTHQGESCRRRLVDAVRREVENAGAVRAFQVLHSLAGGTGSGVGTLMSEVLRDEYPHSCIQHYAVMPFFHGEVCTQWYNTMFAVQHLNETADAITILSNDHYASLVHKSQQPTSHHSPSRDGSSPQGQGQGPALTGPRTSLADINLLMADTLASVALPSSVVSVPPYSYFHQHNKKLVTPGSSSDVQCGLASAPSRFECSPSSLADIAQHAAQDPARKFLEAQVFPSYLRGTHVDHRNSTWGYCVREALRAGSTSPHAILSLRGPTVFDVQQGGLKEVAGWVDSASGGRLPDAVFASAQPFRGEKAFASLFHTGIGIGQRIGFAAHRAEAMFTSRAYVHHFTRYGLEESDFVDALASSWFVSKTYDPAASWQDLFCTDEGSDFEREDSQHIE